ncbi:diguanylate cyclase [Bowmanella yangjiangensis]|uniref:diguanylate cyclase n=1 Tax=Bowmanella yangjiangensis TaxID=2811230 RepID=A0ABS3CQP0_9ALTE|nr:GGDEF domain-containing protein [Bowmanella yangjiangensis]
MRSLFNASIVALLLIAGLASATPAPGLTQLDAPFDKWQSLIKSDPDQLLEILDAQSPMSGLALVQYHLLKSQAYAALVLAERSIAEAQNGLALLSPYQQPWLYHKLHLSMAFAQDLHGTPAKGLDDVNDAIAWAESYDHLDLTLEALMTRGLLLTSLSDYIAAMTDLQRAYNLAPQRDAWVVKADLAGAIALVYEYRREDALALPYFAEAVEYYRQQQSWISLSIYLYGLGRANKNTGNLELAKAQLQESADLSQRINDSQGVAYALKELAGLDWQSGKHELAKQSALQAMALFEQGNNAYMILDSALLLSSIYLAQQQTELANQYLKKARESLNPDSMPLQKIALQEQAARIMAATGQYQQAYETLDITNAEHQTLLSKQSTKQLHQLRSRYELEAQAQQNELLEAQNQLQLAQLANQQRSNRLLQVLFVSLSLILCLLLVLFHRQRLHKKALQQLADTDTLTGLLNRRKTLELLQLQADLAKRHQIDFCVALVDLDHFKKINDSLGHQGGDQVLKHFARLCSQTLRHTDIVGRIGGEEFLIALPHTNAQEAALLLERLRKRCEGIAETMQLDELKVSISIGLVSNTPPRSAIELLARADKILYSAKDAGRNRLVIDRAA